MLSHNNRKIMIAHIRSVHNKYTCTLQTEVSSTLVLELQYIRAPVVQKQTKDLRFAFNGLTILQITLKM